LGTEELSAARRTKSAASGVFSAHHKRRFAIRFTVFGAIVLSTLFVLGTVRAYDLPYDPYPWCANYGGDASGASNCGFLTLGQCQATVSGIGGFCEHNQFYNPRSGARQRRTAH